MSGRSIKMRRRDGRWRRCCSLPDTIQNHYYRFRLQCEEFSPVIIDEVDCAHPRWHKPRNEVLKRFPAEVNWGIPKGQVGSESMRIDSPLGGEPCAARIPVKCEYSSLDLLKREHRGGKPPSSWRSAQVPQLDGCSTLATQQRISGKHHAAEEKIRIVLDGLRGETSIAELCRREGIAESMYYSWSKEFLEVASAGLPETPHVRQRPMRSSSSGARRKT